MPYEWLDYGLLPACVLVAAGCVWLGERLLTRRRQRLLGGRSAAVLVGGLVLGGGVFGLEQLVQAKHQGTVTGPIVPLMPDWVTRKADPGSPAPDFTLVDARTGREVSFSRIRGDRPAVLIFGGFG